jgi:hypothetical protein
MTPNNKYPLRTALEIPNGPRVYVQDDEIGGRTYFSDEVGGGVFVWSTSLVSSGTLLAAIKHEAELQAAGVKTEVELELTPTNPLWDGFKGIDYAPWDRAFPALDSLFH